MSEPDIASAMHAAMDGENRRRELASQRPGHGTEIPLVQSPAASGVGLSDVNMPAAGLGYEVAPGLPSTVHAAYSVPRYADPTVGGYGFQGGRARPAVRHVTDLGDGRLFIEGRSAPAGDGVIVASAAAAARPSLWARLFRRNVQR